VFQQLDDDKCEEQKDEELELLPLVEAPYLPPLDSSQNIYTLVLDLDETLVHYFEVTDSDIL